ncbi:N-acetyl sugar amidotransferase [Synechococcus sp. AH-601-N10]|nr:N-acetyl sugar amidotransferase [Synechococcus sp. AH-601-N10]
MIKTCIKCHYPETHPLGLYIDPTTHICSGCSVHDQKFDLHWYQRTLELKSTVKQYISRKSQAYDCIVPVNGGVDSFYTVHYVKNILKLNPLCVFYNSLYTTRLGFNNLAQLRSVFNVDINIFTPSIEQVRQITKASLYHLNSMYWHVHAGHTSFPVQVALRYEIPLIIWGAHEAVEQVGMFNHDDKVEMSRRYRHNHHLMGLEIEQLEDLEPRLKSFNNSIYNYPDYEEISRIGVRGIYLSNHIPWNSKAQLEFMSKKFKYSSALTSNTHNYYENPHCAFYNGIHDWMKYLKHGYSRLHDHLVRDIRWKRCTTDDAALLLQTKRVTRPTDNIKLFREFMNIKANSMEFILREASSKTHFSDLKFSKPLYLSSISIPANTNSTAQNFYSNAYNGVNRCSLNLVNKNHTFLPGTA